ncbi:MAG: FlgD immunoglobulin-like domain containing protein [Desulfobacterales bacterium]
MTKDLNAQTFYDDCGKLSAQTHLIQGISYDGWLDIDPATTNAQKSISYHPERVIYSYSNLDPNKNYKIIITYLQESGGRRIQRLSCKGVLIHGDIAIPDYEAESYMFMIPKETYNDGSLVLNFIRVFGPNAVVSEITIEEAIPGGILEGAVSVQGAPEQTLAGAKITVGGVTTYSDHSGKYRFDALAEGNYTLSASRTGFDLFESSVQLTSDGVILNIALQASQYGSLDGTITDASDGEALFGVTVHLAPISVASSDAMERQTLTNSNGQFSFPLLPVGSYSLDVSLPGYQTIEQTINVVEGTNVNNFTMTLTASPYMEQEPNNNIENAGLIEIGQPVMGLINPVGDTDYFKLDITENAHLTVSFINVPSNLELCLTILDNGGQVMDTITGSEGTIFTFEINILSPGTYYLKINDNLNDESSWTNYVFKTSLVTGDEFEPNNLPEQAYWLDIGKNYYPIIFPSGDVDYFSFYISDCGSMNLTLSNVATNLDLKATLYNPDFKEIWQRTSGLGGMINEDISLVDEGMYVLKIEELNTNQSVQNYRLLLQFVSGSDELEPNNTFANATPLLLDRPVQASIYPQEDMDFFMVNLTSPGRLNILIEQVPDNIRPNIWIFNALQEVIGTTYSGGEGTDLAYAIELDTAGIYYIKLGDYQNLHSSLEKYVLSVSLDQIWLGDFTGTSSFSPNGDLQSDTCTINTTISHFYPIDHWKLTFYDGSGNPVRSFTGSSENVAFVWDGKDDLGNPVGDGTYTYRLEAWDDQENAISSQAQNISIDTAYPVAAITQPVENSYLQGAVSIQGTATDNDFVSYTLDYGAGASPTEWHNLTLSRDRKSEELLCTWDTSGLSDGVYAFRLVVRDNSGNASTVLRAIEVDRVIFSNVYIHPGNFNPTNGESTTLHFDLDKAMEITVTILDPDSNVIRTLLQDSSTTPGSQTISWDGKDEANNIVIDEAYNFSLEARYVGTTQIVTCDFGTSVTPYINNIAGCETFNPAINENCTISYNLTANAKVLMRIGVSGATSAFRTLLTWIPRTQGYNSELWDGRTDNGGMVGSGNYLIGAWVNPLPDSAVITTGNLLRFTSLNILPSIITPSFGEICTIKYRITKDANLSIIVQDPGNNLVKTLLDNVAQTQGEHSVIWDGKDENGYVICQPGVYDLTCRIKLTAEEAGGGSAITVYSNVQIANE